MSFPQEPSERKVIFVMAQEDIDRCYKEGASGLLDSEVHVLRFPLQEESSPPLALKRIINARLARPGNLLVQSPYDSDLYEELSLAPERFAQAKLLYFTRFCQHLGAKTVNVEQVAVKTTKGTVKIDGKGDYAASTGQVTMDWQDYERIRSTMLMEHEFPGGEPDCCLAEQLLHQRGLSTDSSMQELLEMRRAPENRLRRQKLALGLSNEAKSNFSIVGRLKVPNFIQLTGKYEKEIHEQGEFLLTVVVDFGR